MKKYVFTLMVVLAAFTFVFPLAAQDEGVAHVRIGYFAFDPRENETYIDGELASFGQGWITAGWGWQLPDHMQYLLWTTTTPYFDLPGGEHIFTFVPGGESLDAAFFGPATMEFVSGHTYSLALVGQIERKDVNLLMVDETEAFAGIDPADNYRGVFVHNLAGAPPVNVTVDGETVAEQVSYGQIATFSSPAGNTKTVFSTAEDEPVTVFEFSDASEAFNCELMGMSGTYPGEQAEELFWNVGFANPSALTVLDGGAVAPGDTIEGEVPAIGQRMAYHLSLADDASVDILVDPTGMDTPDSVISWADWFDPMVYVYDASGNLLYWNDELSHVGLSGNAGMKALALPAGEFTIQVGGWADLIGGPFELKVMLAE